MGIEYIALQPLTFLNHEVASADDAACDFRVENAAIAANASQVVDRVSRSICARKVDPRIYPFAYLFAPFTASNDAIIGTLEWGTAMRTTVTLDGDLLAKATKMMGGLDRSTVLREGLKALIERESAIRLAKLGGTQPQLKPVPRRRAAAAT